MEITKIYCPYCGYKAQDIVTSQTEHLLGVECDCCGGFFDIKIGNPNEVFESDSVLCDGCGIRERRIYTTVKDGKRYCSDCLLKEEKGIKNIQCIGMTIEHSDGIEKEDIERAVERATASVVNDHSFINLVKVHTGDMPAEGVNVMLKNIMKLFKDAGANNVVILPINECIHDVTVEKIEVEHK